MAKAGVIGLGTIGSGVAICLARAGILGTVYDIRAGAADGLEGVPPVAASCAEVARVCDTVVIAVVNAAQVIEVLSGPEGVLAAARPGLNVVLVSTVALNDLARIRALTDAAGVGLADCGVTGGRYACQKGLITLVGADDALFAAVKPVLEAFTKEVVHMGGPSAGMAAKIARNAIFFGCLRAGYEGAALARAAGVDVAKLADVVKNSEEGVGGPMLLVVRPDPTGDPKETAAREYIRNLMNKDLEAALELGKDLGVSLPLVELTRASDRAVVGFRDQPVVAFRKEQGA